jgi:energy-coupling factor transporter transmembrane protein EcfT
VDYRKRKGRSKIHPLKDTYNFFLLLMRITMLFNPLRIFMPIAITTFIFSLGSLARDIIILNLTDTTVLLFLFSVIFLMIGLLADLINKRIR